MPHYIKKYIVFFLLFPLISSAQEYAATLRGKVVDKDSKQPLIGVNLVILNSDPFQGTATNDKGEFIFSSLKPGRVSIKASLIGYDEASQNQILLSTGKQTVINLEMSEKITSIAEVVVNGKDKNKANNSFAAISARSFSIEETKRYAATLNDPARMVQTFAGVVSASDDNNQIIIRGNSPKGLLWRMEGVEIPNPNHFAGSEGSTGGGVCMLSSNMLANTDFFSGAFPAEYGNAISGVFDLNLRKGNTEKREYTLQVGILGLEAALEGPFVKKKYRGSYLINYRYSTLNVLAAMGLKLGGNVVPNYQDLSFNFNFPTKNIGHFTLFGLGGLSKLGNKVKQDYNSWKSIEDKTEEALSQKMGVTGITHTFSFSDNKSYLKTIVSVSGTLNAYNNDTFSNQYAKSTIEENKFVYIVLRAATNYNRKVDTKNNVKAGFTLSDYFYDLHSKLYNKQTTSIENKVSTKGSAILLQGYWQWKHRFSERLQMIGGLHGTYSIINQKFYLEPRWSVEYNIKSNHTLSAGIGLHNRIDPISTYVSKISSANTYDTLQNMRLDFTRSLHCIVGYNFSFLKDFRVKTELYYQYLFSIPSGYNTFNYFSNINYSDGFYNIPLDNSGVGYNYGLELTIEKFFSKNYYFMYNLSLFDSKYKTTEGKWRNTAYNAHYVMNATGGKEFVVGKRKVNRIGVNAKIIWRGGMYETPIDLELSKIYGETVYDTKRSFEHKIADYFRIDFGASFRRNKRKYAWIISADIQNVINRKNVANSYFNTQTQSIDYRKNLGIIPVLNWKIEF